MAFAKFTLQESLRLGQLSGLKDRTEAETREYQRLSVRKSRYKRQARLAVAPSAANTEQDWWEEGRVLLTPQEREAMIRQHEACLDRLHWMAHGHEVPPDDPDYVSPEDGLDLLLDSVRENGVTHLGYITKDEDIPSNWGTQRYWRDPDLLQKLYDENWQTTQYVRYGWLAALPDWKVVEFLTKKASWEWRQAADLVGYKLKVRKQREVPDDKTSNQN
jgi:hypothetical protein